MRLLLLLAVLLLVASGSPPGARASQESRVVATAADSAELRERARDAQRHFERVRRRHLPRSLGGGGGPCDDEVGRMCWRHGPGGYWSPEPEDPKIVGARTELLEELERIGRAIPGDDWVLGQRVFYLSEAGRMRDALALARRCGPPEEWWCAALEGLVLHRSGRYPESERAFERALEDMDPERARAWRDMEVLLDGAGREVLEEAAEDGPEHRERAVERLWRLADPLYLVDGNDRRSEHWARLATARIRSGGANPHGIPWGDDLAELMIRYGWEVGWERVSPAAGSPSVVGSVVGHEHPESRSYLPSGEVLRDPASAEAEEWVPSLAYAPSAYAPAYAPVMLPMDAARIRVFPRGDSSIVVARFGLPDDTTYRHRRGRRPEHDPPEAFHRRGLEAGLFLVRPGEDGVFEARARGRETGVLSLSVPAGEYVVSVEAWSPERGLAGRTRHGLRIPRIPRDVAVLTDLLLLDDGPEPASLEEALRRLRPDDRVPSGGRIRVAWEVWGLGFRDEELAYRLTLREPEGGFFRRAGRWLGLVGDQRPQVLEWTEPGPRRPGPWLRSVVMDFPELEPGDYVLRLELETAGRDLLVAERRVEVVRR